MSGESVLEAACDMIAYPKIKHQLTHQSRRIPSLPKRMDLQYWILKEHLEHTIRHFFGIEPEIHGSHNEARTTISWVQCVQSKSSAETLIPYWSKSKDIEKRTVEVQV